MNKEQISLVQNSFKQVAPIAEQAATLFYGRLFELDPSLQAMFKQTDMAEQGRKLMAMLGMAVGCLNKLEQLLPTVRQLGLKHVDYGVKAAHYDTVGAALLWTLAQGLGEAFTPDVEQAWTVTYTALAGAMKEAAYQADRLLPVAAVGE
jgi:nitric oxide dioxygenase